MLHAYSFLPFLFFSQIREPRKNLRREPINYAPTIQSFTTKYAKKSTFTLQNAKWKEFTRMVRIDFNLIPGNVQIKFFLDAC